MTIAIEALDTLFFRDGKPFSMGDDAWANGMFPPLPSVLYGALRTAYMAQKNFNLDEIIEKTKDLRIKQIAYEFENHYYFPMPLDLVNESDILEKLEKGGKTKFPTFILPKHSLENPSHLKELESKSFEEVLVLPQENAPEIEGIDGGMIEKTQFEQYLNKTNNVVHDIIKSSNYVKEQPKIGIGRQNDTRTTEEGKLYRMNMLRPKDLKIYIEFEGLEGFAQKGLLRLGAENKLAYFKELKRGFITIPIANVEQTQTDFKIYLATPAIFTNGYYPTDIFKNTNIEVELLTCAVGKYLNVGGFDMQKREPKPMQKAVPAGSVYYYRLKSGDWQNLLAELQKTGISETEQSQKEGFGIAYLAKV
ncbi:MAG TPA: type III-B CRISPR module-associated protein Cmr3 [Chitinophagales bacterium]|nr:type III-B CRISPR module-associated protein Cmr3 [Chitinophagales bacterium]